MITDKNQILAVVGLPARLDVKAVSTILNFPEHDIPVLVAAKLLEPLGNPAPNAPKFFAREVILGHAKDPQWLSKATKAVSAYWRKKRKKSEKPEDGANHDGVPVSKKAKTAAEKPSTISSTKSSITEQ
ncbi:MAG TPA: hypothetical protein P5525_22805 [Candidatus Paceibacterota bacterium]|nr:hypothetical protein [Verrucomicrobiota bacterium]HRZ58280.1 hypothetical protein [Candidatus Paceibacterota bacterium]